MASFKSAFAAARKGGKSDFKWNGKSYNTKLKDAGSTAPAKSSRPKARPSTAKPTSGGSIRQTGKPAPTSASKTGNRPKARPNRTGQNASGSIRQTGKAAPPVKKNETIARFRAWAKSKIKANSKPSRGSRGRGRG
jgi:hypothetical protein